MENRRQNEIFCKTFPFSFEMRLEYRIPVSVEEKLLYSTLSNEIEMVIAKSQRFPSSEGHRKQFLALSLVDVKILKRGSLQKYLLLKCDISDHALEDM
ncbi:hypothetical protein CEXT_261821 [Caerostris extrusa]|uniref:Uncharacterized protein n=1 Tax=Caerostris extrusa TaxID=172846 RepID=A0AAV4Y192_CAEEX|nr:hypothetical protein CEXT_261821 [Caerostris extrusa]